MIETFNKVFQELEQQKELAHSIYKEYCELIPIKQIHIKRKEIGNGREFTSYNFSNTKKGYGNNKNTSNIEIHRERSKHKQLSLIE